jgi:hypothetical protein
MMLTNSSGEHGMKNQGISDVFILHLSETHSNQRAWGQISEEQRKSKGSNFFLVSARLPPSIEQTSSHWRGDFQKSMWDKATGLL